MYQAFCEKILSDGEHSFPAIKCHLQKNYGLVLPSEGAKFNAENHKLAFEASFRFLKPNLNLQTNIRIDSHWASQSAILTGFAKFCLPDQVIREDQLNESLSTLCEQVGLKPANQFIRQHEPSLNPLDEIYDGKIEGLVKEIYHRDYVMFGSKPWQ